MTGPLIFNFKGKSKNFLDLSQYLWASLNMSPSAGAWSKLFIKYQFSPPPERKPGQSVQCRAIAKNNSFLNHSHSWLEYGLSWPIIWVIAVPSG